MEMKDEMGRLEKVYAAHLCLRGCNNADAAFALIQLVKQYERGDLPKEDWLDKLAFRKMEEIHAVSLSTVMFCAG